MNNLEHRNRSLEIAEGQLRERKIPKVGDDVQVLPISSVCDYLHSKIGKVIAIEDSMFVVELDEPAKPSGHFTPLKTLRCEYGQIIKIRNADKKGITK